MNKIKVTQYFFTNLIDSAHSSFYIERRPKGKWLCYREGQIIMSQMKVSKKSFQTLMRFTSGVQCQKFITDDGVETEGGEVEYDQDDDSMVEAMWNKHGRWGHNHNLPAIVTPTIKKAPSPFIMQIFKPS